MPGEGSVYQRTEKDRNGRPRKRWCAALAIGPRGQQRKLVKYAPLRDNTRDAAKALLAELIAEHRAGRDARDRTTLGDFLGRWWRDYDAGAKQRANAESLIRLWIEPAIGTVPLRDLRPDDVRDVLSRVRSHRSPQQARHVYNLLAVALDRAERDGRIASNPVRRVDRPAVRRGDKRPWSREQVLDFLRASADDRYHALYVFAAGTGLRQGECLGLAWSDVDLERAECAVAWQLQRSAGEYVRVPLKGNRRGRTVPLPGHVVDVLRDHRTRQLAERVAAGRPTEDGLVFVTERGRPVSSSVVTHRLQRIAERADLPRQDFHSLRRFHASLMAALGVHPNVAAGQLGHANVATTLGVYTFVTTDQARAAAALVDGALRTA